MLIRPPESQYIDSLHSKTPIRDGRYLFTREEKLDNVSRSGQEYLTRKSGFQLPEKERGLIPETLYEGVRQPRCGFSEKENVRLC